MYHRLMAINERIYLSVTGDSSKDRGGVRCPGHVPDSVAQVEGGHRVRQVVVPDLHRPVRRTRNEHTGMERVPLEGVHGHVVALVGLQILATVGLGALVDLAFLRAHDEQVLVVPVEVEAAASRQSGQVHLLRVVSRVGHKLELHDRLHFQLVLAHDPGGHLTVRRDGEEVELLGQVLFLPVHLPHRVRVLARADRGRVDGTVDLVAHVKHHDGAVVAAHSQQGLEVGMEVQAHHAGLRGEHVLRVRGVLQ